MTSTEGGGQRARVDEADHCSFWWGGFVNPSRKNEPREGFARPCLCKVSASCKVRLVSFCYDGSVGVSSRFHISCNLLRAGLPLVGLSDLLNIAQAGSFFFGLGDF